MNTFIIPVNTEGKHSDLEFSVSLSTREEAVDCFKRAGKRMLNPATWHELCGALSASFILIGTKGDELHRLAQIGDYFRINIPGPGPLAGGGYDWVKVEAIEDGANPYSEEEYMGMRVRPCSNPQKESKDVAHFFQNRATSSFLVQRRGNKVSASYHGRNELPNVHTAKVADNIRNAIISSGALASLSEAQWSALIKAFLEKEIGG